MCANILLICANLPDTLESSRRDASPHRQCRPVNPRLRGQVAPDDDIFRPEVSLEAPPLEGVQGDGIIEWGLHVEQPRPAHRDPEGVQDPSGRPKLSQQLHSKEALYPGHGQVEISEGRSSPPETPFFVAVCCVRESFCESGKKIQQVANIYSRPLRVQSIVRRFFTSYGTVTVNGFFPFDVRISIQFT